MKAILTKGCENQEIGTMTPGTRILTTTQRRILSIVSEQTNGVQGQWTPPRQVAIVASNRSLDADRNDIETALDELVEQGLLVEKGRRYQPAGDIERVRRPAEL